MQTLPQLFKNNRAWAKRITEQQPDFFKRSANRQTPQYLWIGCSDSRVPANEIIGLRPGELFVHRNVANLVSHTDMNCLSVLQYAVNILKIGHIIVCGHYGCGGVKSAIEDRPHGLIANWLRPVREVYRRHQRELDGCRDETQRWNRLCELNVMQQVLHVGNTTTVRNAWRRGERLTIHGWIYGISNGLLKDLKVGISSIEELKRSEEAL